MKSNGSRALPPSFSIPFQQDRSKESSSSSNEGRKDNSKGGNESQGKLK